MPAAKAGDGRVPQHHPAFPLGRECGLTLPSSGPAYGGPLKSNVSALSMSPLRLCSLLPRRVFVHGLVLPFRLGSRHSRKGVSASHVGKRRATYSVARLRPEDRACYRTSIRRASHPRTEKELIHDEVPHRR